MGQEQLQKIAPFVIKKGEGVTNHNKSFALARNFGFRQPRKVLDKLK